MLEKNLAMMTRGKLVRVCLIGLILFKRGRFRPLGERVGLCAIIALGSHRVTGDVSNAGQNFATVGSRQYAECGLLVIWWHGGLSNRGSVIGGPRDRDGELLGRCDEDRCLVDGLLDDITRNVINEITLCAFVRREAL